MTSQLRRAFRFLRPDQRRRWLLLIPLALAGAALESVAAVAIFLLIRALAKPDTGTAIPEAASWPIVGGWLAAASVVSLAGVVVGLFLLKNGLRLLETHVRERVVGASAASISTRLVRGYLRAPWIRHLEWNTAHLVRNVTAGADTVCRQVLSSATTATSEILVVVAILAVLVVATPAPTLVLLGTVASMVALLLYLTQRSFERWGRELHELSGETFKSLQQTLGSAKEVKVLGREPFFERSFELPRRAMARVQAHRGTLAVVPRLTVETVFVAVLALLGAVAVSRATEVAAFISFLGFFAYAGLRILPSVHLAVYHLNTVRSGRAVVDDLYRDWASLVEGADAGEAGGSEARIPFTRSLVLDSVSFVYRGMPKPAVREVSLEIRRGESVGVVGPTGSGKTTLLDLLLGLLEPTAGSIRVDGVDIHRRLAGWQRQVGYVPQSVFLLDDTLRRNIALGLEEDEISSERLEEAVRLARLDEVVERLPRGLDSVTGERGIRLSGGERQRVAIARALYPGPEILVFDEATSALDRQTERELTAGIDTLRGVKTLIIVAHRMSTVRGCDRLVYLRDGRVVDVGPYSALVERDHGFRELAELGG